MPEFIADTAGTVNGQEWDDLSPFMRGYIEAMLFTSTCAVISMVDWTAPENVEDVEEGRADGSIPTDAGWGDIHPDSAIRAHHDCSEFEQKARAILSAVYATTDYTREQAGRDFWFTRNGHGVGFWDRKQLEGLAWEDAGSPQVGAPGWDQYVATRDDTPGRRLSDIAETFGGSDAYFDPADDSPTGYGYVYLS